MRDTICAIPYLQTTAEVYLAVFARRIAQKSLGFRKEKLSANVMMLKC
jgi:hypothetical protein